MTIFNFRETKNGK